MKPKWLVEHFDDRNSTQLLIEEIKKQGYECATITYLPFQSGSVDVFEDTDCVITQTSINMAQQICKEKPDWIPGPWLTERNYRCSEYYSYLGKYLFNDKYVIMTRSELLRNIDHIYKWLGMGDSIFLRPDSGLKSFTGRLFNREDFNYHWSWVEEYTVPTSLIIASTPKRIKFEWRFIVANKSVITGSLYNVAGQHECSSDYPIEALDLAQEIANNYQPDRVFVIDICQGSDEKYYLLEIGAFSCAGLYACDMTRIVEFVSFEALREWNSYQKDTLIT